MESANASESESAVDTRQVVGGPASVGPVGSAPESATATVPDVIFSRPETTTPVPPPL